MHTANMRIFQSLIAMDSAEGTLSALCVHIKSMYTVYPQHTSHSAHSTALVIPSAVVWVVLCGMLRVVSGRGILSVSTPLLMVSASWLRRWGLRRWKGTHRTSGFPRLYGLHRHLRGPEGSVCIRTGLIVYIDRLRGLVEAVGGIAPLLLGEGVLVQFGRVEKLVIRYDLAVGTGQSRALFEHVDLILVLLLNLDERVMEITLQCLELQHQIPNLLQLLFLFSAHVYNQ